MLEHSVLFPNHFRYIKISTVVLLSGILNCSLMKTNIRNNIHLQTIWMVLFSEDRQGRKAVVCICNVIDHE